MTLYSLDGASPALPHSRSCWIAPDANLIGDVRIGENVSIWFGSTLRGDNEPIVIQDGSNIQEGCVLHTDMGFPLTVEPDCTVGHKALLHGCRVRQGSLVGMGAVLLNGSDIGERSVVGARSLITEGKVFPARSLIIGAPGRLIRELTDEELGDFRAAAEQYRNNIARYRTGLAPVVS